MQMQSKLMSNIDPTSATTGKLFGIVCGCSAIPLIISATYMGLYWGLFMLAADFNDKATAAGSKADNPFDSCGVIDMQAALAGDTSVDTSKWTTVFILNAVVYTCLTAFTLCTVLAVFAYPMLLFGACGHMCGGCAQLAAIIVAGVFRYSTDGEHCAKQNKLIVNDSGVTMEDVGTTLQGLFISQCVLICVFSCCTGLFL